MFCSTFNKTPAKPDEPQRIVFNEQDDSEIDESLYDEERELAAHARATPRIIAVRHTYIFVFKIRNLKNLSFKNIL